MQAPLQSTELVDPLTYLSMVTKFDRDIHDFASKKIKGATDFEGNFWSMANVTASKDLEDNPIYQLLGGQKYFKGISLHSPTKSTRYNIKNAQEFSQQANTINGSRGEVPQSKKTEEFFDFVKNCKVGK